MDFKRKKTKQTRIWIFLLQETNAQLSMMLKEREYEMEAMKEKVSSMTEILQQSEQVSWGKSR